MSSAAPLAALPQQPAAGGEALPPASIAGLDAQPAMPLQFSHAWLAKADAVRQRRAQLHAFGLLSGTPPAALAERGAALAGTLRIPVISVRYSDVPAPFAAERLAARLFGPSVGDTLSLASYWHEASAGLLRVAGFVTEWVPLAHGASHYLPTDGYGWGRFGRMRDFREDVLRAVDASIDFRQFDNDGPDGVPDSGDDDGFVDFVAFLYATRCSALSRAGAIWPHRGAMPPFATDDRGANGDRLRIADYVILPAQDPRTCGPAHVGVLAHEVAHAFGLPDLYDYDGSSRGVGDWGLMGTGSHGSPHSPAHPSAWAKEQLGWAEVRWIDDDAGPVRVPPVVLDPAVFRYDLDDGRGGYLLLENRQRLKSDKDLPGQGLLVWRIDPARGELGAWNTDERRPAVGLVASPAQPRLPEGEADELAGVRLRVADDTEAWITVEVSRDPAPAAVVPAVPLAHLTALTDGDPVERRVPVRAGGQWVALAKSHWLELRVEADTLVLTADPLRLPAGVHRDTVALVVLGGEGAAARLPVSFEIVAPGTARVIADELPWSWGLAARAGHIAQASYGWHPFALRPRPRLLHIAEGAAHPETLARLPAEALYAPVIAADGAIYVIARARGENYLYRVEPDGSARVVASRFGRGPAYGAAPLLDGSVAVATWSGELLRIEPDGHVRRLLKAARRFYQLAAGPGGELFVVTLEGEILRRDADGSLSVVLTGLDRGRLVAIAAAPDGRVYVGERGGQGRIMELARDGGLRVVARIQDADFYGLAVDGRLLYALDLRQRRLLRIPLPRHGPTLIAELHGLPTAPIGSDGRASAPRP